MSASPVSTSSGAGGLPPTPESWLPKEHTFYRPRHSNRQRAALTCALAFFFVPLLLLVLGVRPQVFENRALHDFPSPGDGWGFFTGLSSWADDQLPMRRFAVEAAAGISEGVFGDPPGTDLGSRQGPLGIPAGGGPRTPVDYPDVIAGKDGWLYYGEDVHARCEPLMDVDGVIERLNKLRRAVESSGRRFQLVFAPDKTTMEPSHLPDSYLGKECSQARGAEFWNRVPGATRGMDLRPPLANAKKQLDDPVYDQHDTHWSYAGGMVMTYALAQAISPGSTRTWQTTPNSVRSWPADLERLLGRTVDRRLPSYRLSPDGGADRTRYLASDFKIPLRLTQIGAQPATGSVAPRTAVVADSFSQFAVPFLSATFNDVTVVHTDTVASSDPAQLAELFADRDVVAFQFVERNVTGGASTMFRDQAIDRFARVLAENPR